MKRADYLVVTPPEAVALIPNDAKVVMGLGVAQPPAILEAMANRAASGDLSGMRIYYLLSMPHAGNSVLRYDLRHAIQPMSLFHGAIERTLDSRAASDGKAVVDFIPSAFSQVPRLLCDQLDVDTLVTTVAPMDADGFFSLGTNIDYVLAVAHHAKRVLLEVNTRMPRTAGLGRIHHSRVTALVHHNQELIEVPPAVARAEDVAIAQSIAELIDDGACLQMGIGAVPEAVCAALAEHRSLGVHTELLTPALAALIRCGAVDNSRKSIHAGKTVFAFAMGDRPFYDWLNDNTHLEGHPVEYVNDPAIISRHDKMVSVNATLEVDLTGACNSEHLGGRQFTASGGQLDFVRGATAASGGKSIISCHATAAKGTVSRIVPKLTGPVTTPRNDVDYIVTEFGVASLRGKSVRERARALIDIAHPAYREDLDQAAADALNA